MAEKNCFQESLKDIKTVGIFKFIWQRVPDCRTSVVVRAKSAAKNREMILIYPCDKQMDGQTEQYVAGLAIVFISSVVYIIAKKLSSPRNSPAIAKLAH